MKFRTIHFTGLTVIVSKIKFKLFKAMSTSGDSHDHPRQRPAGDHRRARPSPDRRRKLRPSGHPAANGAPHSVPMWVGMENAIAVMTRELP
jgi:hypothetical protein